MPFGQQVWINCYCRDSTSAGVYSLVMRAHSQIVDSKDVKFNRKFDKTHVDVVGSIFNTREYSMICK